MLMLSQEPGEVQTRHLHVTRLHLQDSSFRDMFLTINYLLMDFSHTVIRVFRDKVIYPTIK